MSSQETVKKGAWAKFMHWYESYQGKKIVGAVYSLGHDLNADAYLIERKVTSGVTEYNDTTNFNNAFKLPHVFRHVRLKAPLEFVHAKVFVLGREISRDPVEITELKALFVRLFNMMLVK